jgi:hypothetical protein
MITRTLAISLLFLSLGLSAQEQNQEPDPGVRAELPAALVEMPEAVPAQEPFDPFARDSYRIDPVVCPFKGDIEYEPGELECGLLEVPENREDPVIYLTGGPGAHVTYYVNRFKDHGLLDHRDMYILEQRGIGFSDDFCPFYGSRTVGFMLTGLAAASLSAFTLFRDLGPF